MTAKDPSTAMADSPAAQVLRLPELLELILLSLPPKDLLLSRCAALVAAGEAVILCEFLLLLSFPASPVAVVVE